MLEGKYLTDCTFVVGLYKDKTETFPGHKVMFVMESPVLEKYFVGKFAEGKDTSVYRLEGFYPNDFKNFCTMIYNSDDQSRLDLLKTMSISDIIELFRICHHFMVSSIINICVQHLESKYEDNFRNTQGMYLNVSQRKQRYSLKDIILLFAMASELYQMKLLSFVEKVYFILLYLLLLI